MNDDGAGKLRKMRENLLRCKSNGKKVIMRFMDCDNAVGSWGHVVGFVERQLLETFT